MLKSLLILAILPIFFISAYADPHTIETVIGSGIPGCEQTEIGCYTPNMLTVSVGHNITMTNIDNALHTYTSGTVNGLDTDPDGIFNSKLLVSGNSFDWTSDTAGEYPYYCLLHVWMQGLIIVVDEEIIEPDPIIEPEPESDMTLDEMYLLVNNNSDIITLLRSQIVELKIILEELIEASIFIPNSAPIIISVVADDPDDLDEVYSTDDTITITFDSDTNMPGGLGLQTKEHVNKLFTFTESLGQSYRGTWSTFDTYTITIKSDRNAGPPVIDITTVTPTGITAILAAGDTSEPSTATSPPLIGDFGSVN